MGSEIVWYGIEWLVGYLVNDVGAGGSGGDSGSVVTASGTVSWDCNAVQGGMQLNMTMGGDTVSVTC